MANLNDNRIDKVISKEDLETIVSAFATISSLLPNVSLTDEERKTLVSMDVDNRIFADETLVELDNGGADIVPAYIKKENLRNDLMCSEQMQRIMALSENVLRQASDANRVASSEAMTVSFLTYNLFAAASKVGVGGAKEAVTRLGKRFEKLGRTGGLVND